MQPTLVSAPCHREGWVYEEKYNGWRMVAYKREGQGRLINRQGKVTSRAASPSWLPLARLSASARPSSTV
jgi:ATP-dependent DNA ligase